MSHDKNTKAFWVLFYRLHGPDDDGLSGAFLDFMHREDGSFDLLETAGPTMQRRCIPVPDVASRTSHEGETNADG